MAADPAGRPDPAHPRETGTRRGRAELFTEGFVEELLDAAPDAAPTGMELGRSREGRPVVGHRLGTAPRRVSLLAGCHADEPVGPLLLRRLVALLSSLRPDHPLLREWEWWIVPHANPDGDARNRGWYREDAVAFDVASYLAGAVREVPGDDMEFGFPHDAGDEGARPENRAIHAWWRGAEGAFAFHASLHGMAFAAGPWFLVEPAWQDRTRALRRYLRCRTNRMGYRLHDVDRRGEKGFVRVEAGFATRPDSAAMRAHFLDRDDPDTAGRFRPGSMEAIRALGGDPLTLVTELPLFITPGVGRVLGPPDPAADAWRARTGRWSEGLAGGRPATEVREEAVREGLRPMPVRDQMTLQWEAVRGGMATVAGRPIGSDGGG